MEDKRNSPKRAVKILGSVLILAAVFVVSFFSVLFVLPSTSIGQITVRIYSDPPVNTGNLSSLGGGWNNSFIYLEPNPGAVIVPRDTYLAIVGPRPVSRFNVSYSPDVTIARDDYKVYGGAGPSSVQELYPTDLLLPNTTYNVTALVSGVPSWWIFTTSSEPAQVMYAQVVSPYNSWVALSIAVLVTFSVTIVVWHRRKSWRLEHD
jgi:hypothetical protein